MARREHRGLAGRLLARLRCGHDVRHDKVRRIRAQIRRGDYENELKLSVSIDRLLLHLRSRL